MKIIKKGILPKEKQWPKEFTCPECKSILEIVKRDIKNNIDPRDGINDYYIDCAFCKAQPDVNFLMK